MSDRRRGLLLALLSLAVYSANLREISSQDTIPTRLLPVAVIRDGRLDLDRYLAGRVDRDRLPYWVQEVDGHYRSSYPVLPALLAVPVYLGPVVLLGGAPWAVVNGLAKLSASLFAALSVLVVYLALRRLTDPGSATGLGLVYAFATSTWSTASQGLWGHGAAALFLAVALLAALRAEEDRRFLDGAGLAVGLMVAARPATALMGAAVAAHLLGRGRGRGLRAVLLGAVVPAGFALHNLWIFGSLQGGYAKINASHPALHGTAGLWATPLGTGLAGLLLSPSRGLLVYSPVLVLALAGGSRLARRHALVAWAALGFALSLVMLGRYSVWWGGHSFGPRLLTDFLPALALFLVPAWEARARSRPLRVALAGLVAVSVAVQAIGALYHPSPRAVDWNASPQDVDVAHHRLWDWQDTQLARLLRNGPRAPGFGEP